MRPFPSPLISAPELHDLLQGDAPPVVLDCSFELADTEAGARAFAQGHIPGAQYAHLDRDLSGPKTGRNGRHPLPERNAAAATAARWGIAPATRVVTCDRQGAPYAARAWWLLRWLGLRDVAVLDGGWAAWLAAGLPQASGPPTPRTAAIPWTPAEPALPTVDATALRRELGRRPLLDARAPERFRGEKEPLDPVAGHIPGALNRPYTLNLAADGRFASPAQLREAFTPLLGGGDAASVIHQCGSGVTACHNLLAMEAAGLHGSCLYPGSWSEWCADAARPVARG